MDFEISLLALAVTGSLISLVQAVRLSVERTKAEIVIRRWLDESASTNPRFNKALKDADASFSGRQIDNYSNEDQEIFVEELTRIVSLKLDQNKAAMIRDIIDKSDIQMHRYSQRLAHSVAGRRTVVGRFCEKILLNFLRRIKIWV